MQEVLRPTFWFHPDPARQDSQPFSVTVWFAGRRAGIAGKPQPRDTFTWEHQVHGILPGGGPVAVTPDVRGIAPGDWEVSARSVSRGAAGQLVPPLRPQHLPNDQPSWWPRRIPPDALGGPKAVRTALRPFARVPGIVSYAWITLVVLGVTLGLLIQGFLLRSAGRPIGNPLLVSGVAVATGAVGAKAWYVAIKRGRRFDGWCVQGFVLGAAAIAAAAPLIGLRMPVGAYLNSLAPGLLIGMAVGRPGCFWAGCCVGRPTTSRWGIWSSNRYVGIRRIPVQLMEAAWCGAVGVSALVVGVAVGLGRSGLVLVGAIAAYTIGRQFLLPLRAEARQTSIGRPVAIVVAAAILAAGLATGVTLGHA